MFANLKMPFGLGLPVLAPLTDSCWTECGRLSISLREEVKTEEVRTEKI